MEEAEATQLLPEAIQAQDPVKVQELLSGKANPCSADSKQVTPLHLAAFAGGIQITALLLEARADPNALDHYGQSPCFFAPTGAVCNRLLTAQADINLLNSKGQSALHVAAYCGLTDTLQWLIKTMKPGLLNVQDVRGRTVFYLARQAQRVSAEQLLLDHGANPDLQPHSYWRSRLPQVPAEVMTEVLPQHSPNVTVSPPTTSNSGAFRQLVLPITIEEQEEDADGAEYRMISPKQSPDQLLHLSDQPQDQVDVDVVELLSGLVV